MSGDLGAIAAGDEVVEFHANGTQRSKVVKIGRTLIHLQSMPGQQVRTYDKVTRRRHDDGGRWGGGFRTLAEQAELDRRSAALIRIERHGLRFFDIRRPAHTTDHLVALADAMDTILTPEEGR